MREINLDARRFLLPLTHTMKRGIAVILMVIYIAFSSGVVINYHFCMNELASARLFEKDTEVCGQCGMHNDNNGCCHDEVIVLKSEDDQSSAVAFHFGIKPAPAGTDLTGFNFLAHQNPDDQRSAVTAPPPLLSGQDIYLQNRVFRI
jgi:hypothetical protein